MDRTELLSRQKIHCRNAVFPDIGEESRNNFEVLINSIETYNVTFLEMDKSHVYVQLGGIERKWEYVNKSDINWLIGKIKEFREEVDYNLEAFKHNGIQPMTYKRSTGLTSALAHALSLNPKIEIDVNKNVTIESENTLYKFNMYALSAKSFQKVDRMIKTKKLEYFAKEKGIKIK